MRRCLVCLLVAALLLFLFALSLYCCDDPNKPSIQIGMSRLQVERILGHEACNGTPPFRYPFFALYERRDFLGGLRHYNVRYYKDEKAEASQWQQVEIDNERVVSWEEVEVPPDWTVPWRRPEALNSILRPIGL